VTTSGDELGSDLHVLAILDDSASIELMQRTLSAAGDRLSVATDLAEGLARTAAEVPDVVLVDVTLGQNAGLAVVHHLRALVPDLLVYALARSGALELGSQAVALGGAGVLILPLSGDELISVTSAVRARRAERELRRKLERDAQLSRKLTAVAERLAEIADCRTRREGAEHLARLLVESAGADNALVYLPAGEGARQLMRAAAVEAPGDPPSFCEEIDLLAYADQHDLKVVRLSLRREHSGLLLLSGGPAAGAGDAATWVNVFAAQAATALALIGEREQSSRSAMKDPSSSAYTFSYFVDVAGREIDKARRYGRRFALATITIEGDSAPAFSPDDTPPGSLSEPGVEAAERVLSVVRDTDVLARVDEREFYLLMPETGGKGAHTCRRRVMRYLLGEAGQRRGEIGLNLTMGVATFPHDGMDLSQLLRIAKHRADAAKGSTVRSLTLHQLPLPEILDTLLWNVGDVSEGSGAGIEAPRVIELPMVDVVGLATAAVQEALRGGGTRVVATHRGGLSIGAAVRAEGGRDHEDVRIETIDITKIPGCLDLEALAIIGEHGAYGLLGRVDQGHLRAVHTADPLFTDLLILRMGEAAGMRLLD